MSNIKFGVCALILNEEGQILMVSRKDNKEDWGLPGGKVEEGEGIQDAIKRELKEETGLDVMSGYFLFGNLSESKGYYILTYTCDVAGYLHSSEKCEELGEGAIKWGSWEEIEKGTFGNYNRLLHDLLDKVEEDYNTSKNNYKSNLTGQQLQH